MVQAQSRQLTNIYLGGVLGKRFGEKWTLSVSSVGEAIHAIDVNTRGALVRYLTDKKDKYYKVALQSKDQLLGEDELRNPVGTRDIYIWPTIRGRNSGWVKIVIGAILIAAAIATNTEWFALNFPATFNVVAGTVSTIAASIGTSLVLGGISQLLAPHQNQNGQLNSNNFQGTVAAGQQGGSVPVVYGKALVAPIPISIWFNAVDWNTTTNAYVGQLQSIGLPGGGMEYVPSTPAPVTNDTEGSGPIT